ncbi:MAG TPA: LLM class flavin-dependent oxidoreductase [Sphingobium sp.]
MKFGLFVNTERDTVPFGEQWDEDLFELVLADELGFAEAWISEHGVTPELLICKAAGLTKQIRMGPGVRPLPFHHPLQVVIEANATDHLTNGRYNLGIGLGGPESGAHAMGMRGIPEEHRRDMMHESIDYILTALTKKGPYDYDGRFWSGRNIQLLPESSVQNPRVPIGISTTGTESTIRMAAEKEMFPIFSHYSPPEQIKDAGDIFAEECKRVGRTNPRSQIRGCAFIYVADTMEQARDDIRDAVNVSIEHHKSVYPHHYKTLIPENGVLADVNFDHLVDIGNMIVGDADHVYRGVRDFYDRAGGLGMFLLLAGKDFGTRDQRRKSWTLFMEKVAPRLSALDPDAFEPAAGGDESVRRLTSAAQ